MSKLNEEYIKYQHLEKLGNTEVEDILFGQCYIFPKLDGTNAHAWQSKGINHFGSRNRELSVHSDNSGFMNWGINNYKLNKLLDHLPDDSHVFGEWLVPHSLKTYKDEAWRKFYIFDILVNEKYLPYPKYKEILDTVGYYDYISPIRIIRNPTLDNIYKVLDENNYLIKDGEGYGEGIVIKNYDHENKYGRVVWAKVVTSEFKEKHTKQMGAPKSNGSDFI